MVMESLDMNKIIGIRDMKPQHEDEEIKNYLLLLRPLRRNGVFTHNTEMEERGGRAGGEEYLADLRKKVAGLRSPSCRRQDW